METKPPTSKNGRTIDEILSGYRNQNLWNAKKDQSAEQYFALRDALDLEAKQAIEAYCAERERLARIDGMKTAKTRVLRRTEIPADAKNPTKDDIVIIGEQISDIIENDIIELQTQSASQEGHEA